MTSTTTEKLFTVDDLPRLKAEVRRLASLAPDFVYIALSATNENNPSCDNLAGGCDKYPKMTGCIIGQAIRNIGFAIPNTCRYQAVGQLLGSLGLDNTNLRGEIDKQYRDAMCWLMRVQNHQDFKNTWQSAIETADSSYVLNTLP